MRNKDAFSGYHPTINFLYFALVLLFSMCLMHPVYLAISLTGALAYDIYLKGRKAVRFAPSELVTPALYRVPCAMALVGSFSSIMPASTTAAMTP